MTKILTYEVECGMYSAGEMNFIGQVDVAGTKPEIAERMKKAIPDCYIREDEEGTIIVRNDWFVHLIE